MHCCIMRACRIRLVSSTQQQSLTETRVFGLMGGNATGYMAFAD